MFTKFASYKVPPVIVSTHGSVVSLAMFGFHFLTFLCKIFEIIIDPLNFLVLSPLDDFFGAKYNVA